MPADANYLVPPQSQNADTGIGLTIKDIYAAHQVAMGCANTLIKQVEFSGNLLPTLPEDQALARNDSSTYVAGWNVGVENVYLSAASTISTFVLSALKELEPLANILDEASPDASGRDEALAQFRGIIHALVSSCCKINPDSDSYLLSMIAMNTHLTLLADTSQRDALRLNAAARTVDRSGVIQGLIQKQSTLQKQLADQNALLAGRALSQLVHEAEFGIEIGEFAAKGLKPGAVAGAVFKIFGEAEAVEKFNKQTEDISEKQDSLGDQIAQLNQAIKDDEAERQELTLTVAQSGQLSGRVADVLALGLSLVDQFRQWGPRLELLAQHSNPVGTRFYGDQIDAGTIFWDKFNKLILDYDSNILG
ncbi:hypothetical protein [Pseudosulfitobacter sp. SM2401]|uniref:hypothetical protein n=1 Tax=Pseudosulfitobacter sp. SM2401 TaxID=3350098 RepID=UPI0036F41D10